VQLATRLPSFQAARDSIAETLEIELTTKRVERLAERSARGASPNERRTRRHGKRCP
jgi:hypothetical protein